MPRKLPVIIDNRDANTVLEPLKLLLPTLHSMAIPTAILTEPTLLDHPKAAELEYRVMVIHLVPENPLSWFCNRGKAGVDSPSNTVMAVL
jgi:hypothetical protein